MNFEDLKLKCDGIISTSDYIIDEKMMKVFRMEIQSLIEKIGPIPIGGSVADISVMITNVQAAKDRISEIANDAHSAYVLMDGIRKVVEDSAVTASAQSSADRRKAEASLLSAEYTVKAAEVEAFHKMCLGTMRNLDSKHDALSRIITCIQMVANGIMFNNRTSADVGVDDPNRRKWNAMKSQDGDGTKSSGKEIF